MTLDTQFMTMISMILGGLYLGLALETFRYIAISWKTHLFLAYFMEICFWFVQSFILFYILYRVNGGEIRAYSVLACLLGFAAYQALFARMYRKLLEKVIRLITRIYRGVCHWINRLIIQPVIWLVQFVITCLLFLLKGISILLFYLLKIIVKPIAWGIKRCYRLLPKNIQRILYKLLPFYSTIEDISKKMAHYLKNKRR